MLCFKVFVLLRWNNGLREAVVARSFLFLSTFFIQCLFLSYKLPFYVSILFMVNCSLPVYNFEFAFNFWRRSSRVPCSFFSKILDIMLMLC